MWAKGERLPLRPHHGLCTAYFVGEGYSGGFKQHMGEVLSVLSPDDPVQLTVGVDEICSACPHNKNGVCESPTVAGHDNAVLEAGSAKPFAATASGVRSAMPPPAAGQKIDFMV